MERLREFTSDVEVYSIDEAFDVSGFAGRDLEESGRLLRQKVKQWTGIRPWTKARPLKPARQGFAQQERVT
jgi:hypothetical protein